MAAIPPPVVPLTAAAAPATASLPQSTSGLPHPNFAVGFLNPALSDCVIRLVPESAVEGAGGEGPETEVTSSARGHRRRAGAGAGLGAQLQSPTADADTCDSRQTRSQSRVYTRKRLREANDSSAGDSQHAQTQATDALELPVSSLLLACNSDYFRALLVGGFEESQDKEKKVTIPLDGADFAPFKDMVYSCYSGLLPSWEDNVIKSLTSVLILADRFGFQSCLELCANKLQEVAADYSSSDSRAVVCLPETLMRLPAVKSSVEAAKSKVVDDVGSLLIKDEKETPSPAFLNLPEACILTLLQSNLLDVKSEDLLFISLCAWVEHTFPAPRDHLAALKRLLPWIGFQFIWPKLLLSWLPKLGQLIRSVEAESWRHRAVQEMVSSALTMYGGWNCNTDTGGLAASVSVAVASQCLSIIALGSPVAGGDAVLLSLNMCTRLGYRSREVAVTLQVPLAHAEKWEAGEGLRTCKVSLSGGWVYVMAKRMHSGTLGVFVHVQDNSAPMTLQFGFSHKKTDGTMGILRQSLNHCFAPGGGEGWGYPNVFAMTMEEVLTEKEIYFPSGVMEFCAKIDAL